MYIGKVAEELEFGSPKRQVKDIFFYFKI